MDAQAIDEHGYTLLHHLLMVHDMTDKDRVARWVQLCARGADPHRPNMNGETADQMLAQRNDDLPGQVRAAMIAWEREALQQAVIGSTPADAHPSLPVRPIRQRL